MNLAAQQTVNLTPPKDTRMRALNSASVMMRRKLCPGSAAAEEGLPNIKNEFSEEGDLLHWHDEHPEVPRDHLTHEQRFTLERNSSIRERYLSTQMQRLGIPEDAKLKHFTEHEMFLCDMDGIPVEPPVPGHTDHIFYYPKYSVAFIFDSKFGRLEVPKADVNMQLRSYYVMFVENFDCAEVHVAITQPWLAAPNEFTACVYTREMFVPYKQELLDVDADTKKPDAKRVPSLEACFYCKAKAFTCKESLAVNTELAVRRIPELSIEDLEAIGEDIELAKKVIEAWENRIRYIAEKKRELLKRYYLGDEQINRKVTDTFAAFMAMRSAGDLLADGMLEALQEFLSCCDVSRHELKIMVAKNRDITQDTAEKKIDAALGELIEQKPKRRSIKKK